MKIIISGGGTGGHIYPALTIADEIKKIHPQAQIIYVGTEAGLERNIVPQYGYDLRYIQVAGFRRSLSWDTLRSLYLLYKGLKQARSILQTEKPDLVIGTGGYVCGPVVWQAARMGIPTCIQEQNALPGVTNKLLSLQANKVFLGYEAARSHFRANHKIIYTGNPIRQDILQHTKDEGLAALWLQKNKKTLLVFGGSRGARSINNAMVDVELALSGREDVQVLHATGETNYTDHIKALGAQGGVKENIHIVPYLHNMPLALAAADLVVCRAGAIGLAEIAAKGLPAILIPFPYATGNHQEYNAWAVSKQGAGRVILDKNLDSKVLLREIEDLLAKPQVLKQMHEAALELGRPRAGEDIARQALALVVEKYRILHFVGIGGAGMSAIASVLLARGYQVQGSDLNGGPVTDRLAQEGAKIFLGHRAEQVRGADCVVLSSAIHSDNPEVVAAKEQGIPILHRSDVLSWLINDGAGVTVAGAHGKTTTTSMLAVIAKEVGLDATALVGGDVGQLGSNALVGQGKYVIAEADESDGSFLKFHPQLAVITNIEDDHLDHYGTEENIYKAFKQYLQNVKSGGSAVLCVDNLKVEQLASEVSLPAVTYGIDKGEYQAREISYSTAGTTYKLYHNGEFVTDVQLIIPGRHNVLNSLGAFAAAVELGVSEEKIVAALASFSGAKRRFETKARIGDLWFVDDYAHHPTEIKAVLKAARQTGAGRIVVCFQPHRYTRTKLLLEEFKSAFSDCDVLAVTDVYAASEEPLAGGTSDVLVQAIRQTTGQNIVYTPSYDDAYAYLRGVVQSGDLVMSIGAGRADLVIDRLIADWEKKNG